MTRTEITATQASIRKIRSDIVDATARLGATLTQLSKCGSTTADEDFLNAAWLNASDLIERAAALTREAKRIQDLCKIQPALKS